SSCRLKWRRAAVSAMATGVSGSWPTAARGRLNASESTPCFCGPNGMAAKGPVRSPDDAFDGLVRRERTTADNDAAGVARQTASAQHLTSIRVAVQPTASG